MISEVVVLGILGLRQSLAATPLMIPLIVVSALFYAYVGKQHFNVAEHLTADACMQAEMKQIGNFDVRSFTTGQYVQPALKHEGVTPDLPEGVNIPERDIEAAPDDRNDHVFETSPAVG
jgi:hypothetical protein